MTNSTSSSIASRYFQQGFVHPLDILSGEEALDHHARLQAFERSYGPLHYRVKPYLLFSSAYELATCPALLDVVEAVLGPDILLWDAAYVIKEPYSEGYISWHQDMTYWGLDTDSDDDVVSVWLALTHAHKKNGCMQFVRASHRGPRKPHHDTHEVNNLLHRGQTIEDEFDADQIEYLEMSPGQCSLHHGWAIHASNANHTAERRVALAINFVRPSVRQTVADGESATLVRGSDRYRHFVVEPPCGEDNVPENIAFQREAERLKRLTYDTA